MAVGTPIIRIGEAAADRRAEEAGRACSKTAEDEHEIDLSNPAASGGGEGESLVGRNKADRGPTRRPRRGSASPASDAGAATQMQLQGAFTPGGAQSEAVVESDEPAVPAAVGTPEPAPEPPRPAHSPSRRCASWPRTSVST